MPFIGRGSTGQSGGAPSGGQYGGRYGGRGPSTAGLPSGRSSAAGAAAEEGGLTAEYAIECAGESQPRWDAWCNARPHAHDVYCIASCTVPYARCNARYHDMHMHMYMCMSCTA